MNIILYAAADARVERLEQRIEEVVPKNKIEIFHSIAGLCRKLRQPVYDLTVAVLFAANREDLIDLLSIRNLFVDVRIILLLPDEEERAIAGRYICQPVLSGCIDSDFKEVSAAIRKMLYNYEYYKEYIQ